MIKLKLHLKNIKYKKKNYTGKFSFKNTDQLMQVCVFLWLCV